MTLLLESKPAGDFLDLLRMLRLRWAKTIYKLRRLISGDTRPHLLVVVPWLPIGGAEIILADILTHLAADWRLTIVTTERDAHRMEPSFKVITPEIYHLPNFLDPQLWQEFIIALIESRGTTAVLSSGSKFFYDSLKSIKSQIPAIETLDILHNDQGHLAYALTNTRYIDRHIAVSERIGRSLKDGGVDPQSIVVIPNGVDFERLFAPDLVAAADARSDFGIAADAFVIGFVGRMSPEKRPLAFLDVAAPILAAHPTARLLVVGDGPLAESFTAAARAESIANRLHHVRRLEHGSMPKFYAACDIVVLTSKIEGAPLSVLEALAMGCPVAVTDAGDLRRIITDGVNGFIASVDSPADLTSHVATLALDREKLAKMRTAARQTIVEKGFSAERMLNTYKQLLGSPRRRAAT